MFSLVRMSDSDFRARQSTMVDSLLEEHKGDLDRAVCMVNKILWETMLSVFRLLVSLAKKRV